MKPPAKPRKPDKGATPESHKVVRQTIPKPVIKELTRIPGVGPSLAADLYLLGIEKVSDLKGKDPEEMFQRTIEIVGVPVDRCVLYTFRCAVYFAVEESPEPEKLKWWNWKDAVLK